MNYGKKATKKREAKIDAKSTKIGKRIGLWIGRILLVAFLFVAVVGISTGVGVWKGIVDSAPDISAIDVTPTGYSTTVLAANGEETATLVASGANRKYVTIDEIPLDMQHAFVAIEDERFYEHNGIDPKGILRAGLAGIKNGFHFNQGASTITQQLIKNSVLEETWANESSKLERLQRKLQEQYIAVQLEKQVNDKDWILENYLNTINLGSNTLGVQAASEKYFGKDVSELTLSESAVIAGITKNPSAYNPITHPENNAKRRELVLDAMLEQEYINEEQYKEALEDPVYDRIAEHYSGLEASVNSYFVDAVIDDVYDDLVNELGYTQTEAYKAIYQGGLTIYSTQDLDFQAICDEEANNLENYPDPVKLQYSFQLAFQVKKADGTFKKYTNQTMLSYYKEKTGNPEFDICYETEEECYAAIEQYKDEIMEDGDSIVEGSESIYITLQPQMAMTIIDQATGEVKALVGGRGEKVGDRTWNRATDTTRQPGSTFKIIGCYAAAIDTGLMTLASVQDDAPYTVGEKSYRNASGKYSGYTTLREAITDSINIVTVKTLNDIGISTSYEYVEKFGFTTLKETDKNLGLALGGLTNGVTNLELTAAYAAIANGGTYIEPKFYTVVLDHDGNILLDKNDVQEKHEVIQETTAWLLTNAMQDVLTAGSGTRAYFGATMAQAGKTGTTTNNRDFLMAGYTPYYTCTVWGGNDDNSSQIKGSASIYTKLLWKNVMARIHEGLPYKDFTMPAGIVTATVCRKSGLLPITGACDADPRGSMLYTEYFAEGTEPGYEDVCDHHALINMCEDSNLPAGIFCPQDRVTQRVYVLDDNPESPEAEYAITTDTRGQICTVHTASSLVPTIPDVDEDDTANPNGSTNSNGSTNPNGSTNSNGATNPNGTANPNGTTNPNGTANPNGTTNSGGGTTTPNGGAAGAQSH